MSWALDVVPALVELCFFNQWILTTRSIAPGLVVIYAAVEPISCWIIKATNPELQTGKLLIHWLALMFIHLFLAYGSEAWKKPQIDERSTLPRRFRTWMATDPKERRPRPQRILAYDLSPKDTAVLAIATATAASLNAVFVATQQSVPSIEALAFSQIIAGYIPTVLVHMFELLLCWSFWLPPFVGFRGFKKTKQEFGLLAVLMLLRGAIRRILGVGLCGPIERAAVSWYQSQLLHS